MRTAGGCLPGAAAGGGGAGHSEWGHREGTELPLVVPSCALRLAELRLGCVSPQTQLGKGELLNGLCESPLCPITHEGSGLEIRVVHQPRHRRILLGLSGPFDANAMLASVERARGGGGGKGALWPRHAHRHCSEQETFSATVILPVV